MLSTDDLVHDSYYLGDILSPYVYTKKTIKNAIQHY